MEQSRQTIIHFMIKTATAQGMSDKETWNAPSSRTLCCCPSSWQGTHGRNYRVLNKSRELTHRRLQTRFTKISKSNSNNKKKKKTSAYLPFPMTLSSLKSSRLTGFFNSATAWAVAPSEWSIRIKHESHSPQTAPDSLRAIWTALPLLPSAGGGGAYLPFLWILSLSSHSTLIHEVRPSSSAAHIWRSWRTAPSIRNK